MTYTHGHHESVLRSHTWRTAENSSAYLLPHLRPGQRLLDVGCGPGTITADLALMVAPGEAVGIDAAADVVAQAQEHARGLGVENLRFEVADLFALGFPDASFDVIHLHQVLQHLEDPVAALVELRRVLDPDGRAGRTRLGLRGLHVGAAGSGPGPLAQALLRGHGTQRPRRPHRAPPPRPRPRSRLLRRHRVELDVDLRRARVRGPGGAASGPTGCATRALPNRRSSTASATPTSWSASPRRGSVGRTQTTVSSSSPTWRSWPGADRAGQAVPISQSTQSLSV